MFKNLIEFVEFIVGQIADDHILLEGFANGPARLTSERLHELIFVFYLRHILVKEPADVIGGIVVVVTVVMETGLQQIVDQMMIIIASRYDRAINIMLNQIKIGKNLYLSDAFFGKVLNEALTQEN